MREWLILDDEPNVVWWIFLLVSRCSSRHNIVFMITTITFSIIAIGINPPLASITIIIIRIFIAVDTFPSMFSDESIEASELRDGSFEAIKALAESIEAIAESIEAIELRDESIKAIKAFAESIEAIA